MRVLSTIYFVAVLVRSLDALGQTAEQTRRKALSDASAAAARLRHLNSCSSADIWNRRSRSLHSHTEHDDLHRLAKAPPQPRFEYFEEA